MTSLSARDRNKRTGAIVVCVVIGMVALSFASVLLYRLFCQATGLGGRSELAGTTPSTARTVLDRAVTVQFNADVDARLPWVFTPNDRAVTVRVGADGMTSFTAINESSQPVTGAAVFNVLPEKAGKYFHKTQCFCFQEQTLAPHQRVNMPVLFYVDPAFGKDPDMADVRTLTLSYTFYRAESSELDRAIQNFR